MCINKNYLYVYTYNKILDSRQFENEINSNHVWLNCTYLSDFIIFKETALEFNNKESCLLCIIKFSDQFHMPMARCALLKVIQKFNILDSL